MSVLTPYASTLDAIAAALAAAGYELVHANLHQLPAPHFLIVGDADLPAIPLTTGTLVVTGSLRVTAPVDFQQTGRPIVNLVVVKDCTLGLAYIDAFLCVGRNLTVGTLIADSNWSGGVFVGGDLRGHTLVIKDIGVEVDGTQHLEKVADCDDPEAAVHAVPALFIEGNPDPRALFLALRDSSDPPQLAAPRAPRATPKASAKPKAAARAKTKAKAKPTAKTKAKAKPTAKAKAKAKPTPKAKAKAKPTPKAKATAKPKASTRKSRR